MKKTILILLGVAVLVSIVYYTDRKLAPVQAVGDHPAKVSEVPNGVSFKSLDGKSVNLSDLRGKVVFVDFWETTCGPCKIEIPWLIELQQKYQAQGLTILGVAMDTDGKSVVAPWVAKERFDVNGVQLPINYPIVLGDDKSVESLGQELVGFPTTVLISRDGKIIKTTLGLVSFDEIEKDIKSQLGT